MSCSRQIDRRSSEERVSPGTTLRESRVCTVVYRRAHKVYHGPFEDPQGTAIELAARGAVFAEVCAVLADEQSTERIASIIAGWIDRGWFERLEGG
jgi:hypothetical protein